ncbi:hypothetical protein [Plantactinospora sp. WMMB782]|uniref:hypothetical protein n=1 Tax=Plantactinospora sp. WMMB782 TaxID=3404121 RepID=UPI003B94F04C
MSLTLPLAVRLATSAGDVHITRRLHDLSFRITAPGGFASITMSLHEPITNQPDWLQYYARAYVYDQRTGAVLCEGRLEDPGRSAGPDGQIWDLVAVGPAAHAKDRNVPLIYVDRQIEQTAWRQADLTGSQSKGSVGTGDGTSNATTMRLQWDSGQSVQPNHVLTARYSRLVDTGQWVARAGTSHIEGVASSVLKVEMVSRRLNGYVGTGSDATLESDNWATSSQSLLQRYGDEHTDRFNAVDLRLRQGNASAVTSGATYYTNLTNTHVLGSRYLKTGAEKTSGYVTSTVLASDVVEDLLGRLLPLYDGTTARVDATSHTIEQLAYPDGIDPAGVLDDLMRLEPAYLWEALESNSAGKHRFNWRAWPTDVRYEADVSDAGYDAPGSADGLYNAVTVRWRDIDGASRTTRVTQDVPALTAAGLTREPKPIDLGDETGSVADATRVGQQFLAEHRAAPNAGRLRLARPVLDLDAGVRVMPWEVRPGYLIRVRGVLPRPDALNATTRDGVTVFKIASTEFRASDATATLELDSYAPSTARALADLLNRPVTRRR